MKILAKLVSIIVLVFVILYTSMWYIASEYTKTKFRALLSSKNSKDSIGIYVDSIDKVEISGFPFSFKIDLKDIKILIDDKVKNYKLQIDNIKISYDLFKNSVNAAIKSNMFLSESTNKKDFNIILSVINNDFSVDGKFSHYPWFYIRNFDTRYLDFLNIKTNIEFINGFHNEKCDTCENVKLDNSILLNFLSNTNLALQSESKVQTEIIKEFPINILINSKGEINLDKESCFVNLSIAEKNFSIKSNTDFLERTSIVNIEHVDSFSDYLKQLSSLTFQFDLNKNALSKLLKSISKEKSEDNVEILVDFSTDKISIGGKNYIELIALYSLYSIK